MNVKSGSVGDIAYNVVVGGTGNAFKTANAGGLSPQANMNCYNNTVVTTGYRQAKAGEGGSIDFENGGRGNAYNNLIVDCAYGLSVLGGGGSTPAADTANVHYGYTYNYGDNSEHHHTVPACGFHYIATVLGYQWREWDHPGRQQPKVRELSAATGGDGQFQFRRLCGQLDFHLQSGSPGIGKGFTGFSPYGSVKVDPSNYMLYPYLNNYVLLGVPLIWAITWVPSTFRRQWLGTLWPSAAATRRASATGARDTTPTSRSASQSHGGPIAFWAMIDGPPKLHYAIVASAFGPRNHDPSQSIGTRQAAQKISG